jgi:hypothetical protein
MDSAHIEAGQRELDRMLLVLHRGGFVKLEPEPPEPGEVVEKKEVQKEVDSRQWTVDSLLPSVHSPQSTPPASPPPPYKPVLAHPTPQLARLSLFRSVNPLYGIFLINQLGIADRNERVQAFESVLEFPGPVARYVRVPKHDELPPGLLATTRLDMQLLQFGLAEMDELVPPSEEDQGPRRPRHTYDAEQDEEKKWVLTLAEKLRRLFDYELPGVRDLRTTPVWAAGEILARGGDFDKFIKSKDLQKQEGIVFRHLLRLVLLVREFLPLCPPDVDPAVWRYDLEDVARRLTDTCHAVDPASTDRALEQAGEEVEEEPEFGAGVFD